MAVTSVRCGLDEPQIGISGVGFDIGCGNMAVRLDVQHAAIADRAADILADIRRVVSFGGSMGDDAVIVEGVDSARSAAALYSTVHGAGRLFSRTAAKRTFRHAQMDAWLEESGVMLRGDLDESPMAYRRLPDVLAHHAGTIRLCRGLPSRASRWLIGCKLETGTSNNATR